MTCTDYRTRATSTNKWLYHFVHASLYITTLLVYPLVTTSTLYWITTNTSATYTTRPSCSLLVYEKSVTKNLLHPSVFWHSRETSWAKVHQSGWWHIAGPPLSSCRPVLKTPLRDICWQSLSISLMAWPTDRQTEKNSKWYSLHITMQRPITSMCISSDGDKFLVKFCI